MDWLAPFIGGGVSSTCPSARCPTTTSELQRPGRRAPTCSSSPTPSAASRPTPGRSSSPGSSRCRPGSSPWSSQSTPGDLAAISDEVHQVASLAVTEAGVERVLSL